MSTATPHVTGAAALRSSSTPTTAEQVKRQLMQSATGAKEHGAYFQGAGRVYVALGGRPGRHRRHHRTGLRADPLDGRQASPGDQDHHLPQPWAPRRSPFS